METNKKVVSPFEFAITEVCDPEKAKEMRPETREERMVRVYNKFKDFTLNIKYTRGIEPPYIPDMPTKPE